MSIGFYRDNSRLSDIKNLDVPLQLNCTVVETKTVQTNANSVRNDYYMIYMSEGSYSISKPIETVLNPGSLIIFPPDTPFTYQDCGEPTSHYSLHFTGSEAANLLEKCGIEVLTVYNIGKLDSVFNDFHSIFCSFMPKDVFFDVETATKVSSLLINIGKLIYGDSRSVNANSMDKLRCSLEYISENYTKPITVRQLAEMECLSESRYRALFTSVIKKSPLEYITEMRINTACRMLQNSRLSVLEIGEMVGYPDTRYFSRVFKKICGVTPSEYRNGRLVNS